MMLFVVSFALASLPVAQGKLTGTNIVQRLNTKGGVAAGPCETAGSYRSVPYSADYLFLRKS
jgi:hypothetical protein